MAEMSIVRYCMRYRGTACVLYSTGLTIDATLFVLGKRSFTKLSLGMYVLYDVIRVGGLVHVPSLSPVSLPSRM